MSTKTYVENNIETIEDDREYYLNLPHLIVSSITSIQSAKKVYNSETNKIDTKEIEYNQALVKQIEEAVQNSLDENRRTHGDYANTIHVIINQETGYVTTKDNGRGIPLNTYVASATNFKTGSNFNWRKEGADKERLTVGAHGIGNKVIPLFSTDYTLTTVTLDGDRGTLTCKNNMYDIVNKEDKAPKSAKHGVELHYKPDFKRMGIDGFSDDIVNHVHALLINIAGSYPNVSIYFQGKLIKVNTFNDFLKYYTDYSVILHDDEKMSLAIYPTEEHQFLHVVNSIDCSKGGTALTYVTNSIVTKFAERLQKSYKKVTNAMVKNRIGIVMVLKDISNLKFAGGQTKEEIKNLYTEMSLPSLNYIEISEKLFKAPKIKDPIIELVKILAELEKRTANAGLKAEKTEVFNPKLLKATKKSVFTMIAEGDSAVDGLPQVFGREYITYMPLSGKLLNCIKSTPATLKKNARVMDIINAVGLGLEETKSEGIIIAVDKDTDGIGHIKSLIISLIYTVHPQMLKDGKVFYLDTPIMSITDKDDKLIKWYSTLEDYQADFDNIPKNTNHNYNKGLGSTKPEDFKLIKDTDGFESMLVQIQYDEALHEQTILNWMADETVDIRKDMLATESFYINDI